MKIRSLFKRNSLTRSLYNFGCYVLGFCSLFALSTTIYYQYTRSTEQKEQYRRIEEDFKKQIQDIEQIITFILKRALNASNQKDKIVQILQSYYPLKLRNGGYHPILDIYLIDKNDNFSVTSAYGPTRLRSLIPILPLKGTIKNEKDLPFKYVVNKGFLWCFFLNSSAADSFEERFIVLLRIPLQEVLHEGEELHSLSDIKELKQNSIWEDSWHKNRTLTLFFPKQNLALFVKQPKSNFVERYLEKFGLGYLVLIFSIFFFGLYTFISGKKISKKISGIYKKKYDRLSSNNKDQREDIQNYKLEIMRLQKTNQSLILSKKVKENLQHKYTRKLAYLENRILKKLDILIQDLTENSFQDTKSINLLEITRTAKNDFGSLVQKIPEYQGSENISLQEVINESLNALNDVIVSKSIDITLTIKPESLAIYGDEVFLQILFVNLLHKSLERVNSKGKIKINILGKSKEQETFKFELWDDGYNFNDSRLLRYAASDTDFETFFCLKWEKLKDLMNKCGGEITEKVNQTGENRLAIIFKHGKNLEEDKKIKLDNIFPISKAIN